MYFFADLNVHTSSGSHTLTENYSHDLNLPLVVRLLDVAHLSTAGLINKWEYNVTQLFNFFKKKTREDAATVWMGVTHNKLNEICLC